MESATSPVKKIKSPAFDNINTKTSIVCSKVPDCLFETPTAKKHFSKFGRVQKIKLFPKRQMCIVEYDQPLSAERAVLNAGAFDGFMFDVTRTKTQIRRKNKKDDDPDWVPDSDVEEELSAMRGAPTYRTPRQKAMEMDPGERKVKLPTMITKFPPKRKIVSTISRVKQTVNVPSVAGDSISSVTVTSTSLGTSEAAVELHQLRSRISLTPDEQWRTLDARDRILRAWGGAGSRVKIGGATIGTCPDMCPEKELLHRQAEHQVMTLETVPDSDGQLEPWRAVKQYTRSSADQEIPMCYELRPASVLARTCAYLLNEIADTSRQVSLADWFHFMWDRFRGIRKDITQQALCCAESIRLVEICARFHAHCAARLADLEHTQFDQKLNTDNLTKCLQTLKHMYMDVGPELKPKEAEFRGYIALLNLGDSNFWWEIKQLPKDIQKSSSITFAIQVFTALDNNNYVKFFRLVKDKATYLQACILLRYFNDVRARAIARIVKAYAPRGGSRYPAEDIMNALAFESIESMKSFVNHYGLRFSKTDEELTVILDRNQFIEDSDPYPVSRAISLIESKRQSSVGEVIAGGPISRNNYDNHILYSSFQKNGRLKETALLAEDLGYNTINDSNKEIKVLKSEIQRLSSGGRNYAKNDGAKCVAIKSFSEIVPKATKSFITPTLDTMDNKSYSFQPPIVVASADVIKALPGSETKRMFSFSTPQQLVSDLNIVKRNFAHNPFLSSVKTADPGLLFRESKNNIFKQSSVGNSLFMPSVNKNKSVFSSSETAKNIFAFNKPGGFNDVDPKELHRTFNGNNNVIKIFDNSAAPADGVSSNFPKTFTFGKVSNDSQSSTNIFKSFTTPMVSNNSIFGMPERPNVQNIANNHSTNAETRLSPSTLFKNACQPEKEFSFFPSKNKAQTVADSILNSLQTPKDVYEFQEENAIAILNNQKSKVAEAKLIEEKKKEEERLLKLKEEAKKQEEERERLEKQKQLEEAKKKEEERKQEELRKKKLEEERRAELKRKALEEERLFKEKVEKESEQCVEDLLEETSNETTQQLIKEELETLKQIILCSQNVTEELVEELCRELCKSEIIAESIWTQKLMKKWYHIWKKQYLRNKKRRSLLEDTPVWLTNYTPIEEAKYLKRIAEVSALRNMNAIHKGYKFVGELTEIPPPEPYNIMEIIRSPLLKRMKQINYPYDKCFFWKVALVSTLSSQWLYRRINIENWLLATLGDKNKLDNRDGLIYVRRQSWNHLMDFAISVSLTNRESKATNSEAIEGANGFLFYSDDNYLNTLQSIQEIMKCKYPYQKIPVAFVTQKVENSIRHKLEENLNSLVESRVISGYRLFMVGKDCLRESLHSCTKSALKWLAKNCPKNPSIEIDHLKSICQRYLGNEIWHKLRSKSDSKMVTIQHDLNKLVNCYNAAVDKLTDVITNEDLFNYPSFPLEFNEYLDQNSPYPKPYEFIPSNVKQPNNILAIKSLMKHLKLINSTSKFLPSNTVDMKGQIRGYCKQIGWFDPENPEKIVSKVVAVLPNNFFNVKISSDEFSKYFEQYNLIDFLNVVIYEKINSLHNFDNICAIYEKASLDEYRDFQWIYDIDVFSGIKHKVVDYEDDVDTFIHAKRRKLEISKMKYLTFEEKDCSLVKEAMTAVENNISSFIDCSKAMSQLEKQLDEEKKKSEELENLLRAALSQV